MEQRTPQHPAPERTAPYRPAPVPEKPEPVSERPKDSSTPGQQQFMKRMLADLVSRKAERAAGTQKDKGSAHRPPSTGKDSTRTADSNSGSQQDMLADNTPRSSGQESLHPAPGSHSQSPAGSHPVGGSHSQNPAGSNKVQQDGHRHTPAPAQAARKQGDWGASNSQQSGYNHFTHARAGAGYGRGAAPQQNVPYVPVIPETDSRYKTVLCMYHKQNRCPRGDTCSFAHSLSELRRKPRQQVLHNLLLPSDCNLSGAIRTQPCQIHFPLKAAALPRHTYVYCMYQHSLMQMYWMQATVGKALGHAAAYASSAPTKDGAKPSESGGLADAQPDSKASEASPVDDSAPAAGAPAQTSTAEQPVTEERKVQHSLPPMIQQLLSKTAKLKLPMPEALDPAPGSIFAPASAPQAEAAAPFPVPSEQSSSETALPQAAIATAQAPHYMQGSLFPGLSGEAPHFGSLLALPPPTDAATRAPIQFSFGSISEPQLTAEPEPASSSLPSAQISALFHEGTPHSSGPAEHSNGHARPWQPETTPDRPAEELHEPVGQAASVGLQGALPSHHLNGDLQSPQPYAAPSTMPENPAPKSVQRPQPVKRPQPVRKAYMPSSLPPKPSQPSARPPPPGFGALPASASRPQSSSSMQSALSAAGRQPDEAPPQAQQPKRPEPAAAAADKEQGMAPSATPGSSGASESSWHSASTHLGKQAQPEMMASPRSTSSHSSSMQHQQPTANGMAQHHEVATPVTMHAARGNSFHSAHSKQLQMSPATQSGEEDDVPHCFCCPITQVGYHVEATVQSS